MSQQPEQDGTQPSRRAPSRRQTSPETPLGGVPLAPRGRRRDHLTVALLGAVLAPAALVVSGAVNQTSLNGDLVLMVAAVAGLLVLTASAHLAFARRSSLGGLVGGLVALCAQGVIVLAARGAADAPFEWARTLIPTGLVLIVSALLIGGSWGMRIARRAGRGQARTAARLAQNDREIGATPAAPPPRRRDHVLSLVVVAVMVPLSLALLQDGYAQLVSPSHTGSPTSTTSTVAAFILLLIAATATGCSTLGARTLGPLLVLASLPTLLAEAFPTVPGAHLLREALTADPAGISLLTTGILLSSIGWGAHLARQRGRASEHSLLRVTTQTTPA